MEITEKDIKEGSIIKFEGSKYKIINGYIVWVHDDFTISSNLPLNFVKLSDSISISVVVGMVIFNKEINYSEIELIK